MIFLVSPPFHSQPSGYRFTYSHASILQNHMISPAEALRLMFMLCKILNFPDEPPPLKI